jgi:hypothetical protein
MDISSLRHSLERPEVVLQILAGYSGPYSLGIGKGPAIVLQILDADQIRFPARIFIGGEAVPVIVRRGFRMPEPLTARVG